MSMINLGCVGLVLSFAASASAAPTSNVSQLVQNELTSKKSTEVFVVLKSQADLSSAKLYSSRNARIASVYKTLVDHANKTQAPLLAELAKMNAKVKRYFITNAILIENANQAMVDALSKRLDVKKIVGNPSVMLILPRFDNNKSLPAPGVGENITSTGADRAWSEFGAMGQGVVVAGQDTGYQWDHPALKNAYRGWNGSVASHDYNWHDAIHAKFNDKKSNVCGYDLKAPCDDDKHGTHTMGTMVGSDGGSNQIGMAPKAKWIGCRNMDSGAGKPASYLECFQFFLAPTAIGADAFTAGKPEMAPHVINNSWGCPSEEGCSGEEILPALKAMKAAGILVVASAGNDGPGCSSIKDQPATHTEYVLSVGAHDHRSGNIASFSSRGPSAFNKKVGPDVTAPGVSIRSSVPGGKYEGGMWSGTSMAGPHVVGEVALIMSANKNYIGKVDETIALIRTTAKATSTSETCGGLSGSSIPNNTYGYGKIQVLEAVKTAKGVR